MRIAPDSIRLRPLSRSTIAGMRLLGLICRNSGLNCSSLLMSTPCAVYGNPSSSRAMETLRPLGVFQVYRSITASFLLFACRLKNYLSGDSRGVVLGLERNSGEPRRMIADILGPRLHQPAEGRGIAGKERARGILEADAIARHRRHEAVSSVLRRANAVLSGVRAHGVLHELAQCDRRAAGLARQPVPVTRQQRHLVGDNAEFRAAGSAR